LKATWSWFDSNLQVSQEILIISIVLAFRHMKEKGLQLIIIFLEDHSNQREFH
jgi:hypothetical protein